MEEKELKYWGLVFLLSYIPTIGFHFLIRPLYHHAFHPDFLSIARGLVSLMESGFTIILLPVYLVLTYYFLAKKFKIASKSFILNGLIILSCILVSTHFHFKNMEDSINDWRDPESVFNFERAIGIITSLIGLLIVYFNLRTKTKDETKITNAQD